LKPRKKLPWSASASRPVREHHDVTLADRRIDGHGTARERLAADEHA
jgi:hypothetical protein